MTGRLRPARVLSGRVATTVGRLTKPCPRCGAAVGWRCGRYIGSTWTPIESMHKERR